ncbi:ABC transporter permease [Capnocytophaga canis]|uniref:ABC transporter permease n=1 Tax=Capnocytophaga canis TaxID=1848903 RepID=UPI00385DA838
MAIRFTVIRENIKIALESIKSQLLRTILTVLIIAIGITALVGILSVITALRNTLEGNFSKMGSNTFSITRYQYTQRVQGSGANEKINPPISYQNAIAFREQLQNPFAQTSISLFSSSSVEVKYENQKTDPSASIFGVDEFYIKNSGLELQDGRDFSKLDIENNTEVCVIGADFTKKLLKDINPIGKVISIKGHKFTIIGVLQSEGSTFGNNEDMQVLIPLGIARSIFTLQNPNFAIKVKVTDKDKLDVVMDDALIVMRNIRSLRPLDENNFGMERSDDLLHRIESITQGIGIAGFVIGLITILGSSIALLNIMLVSVTERTKEIGIRKALGAHRKAITMQFFTETVIIAQLGAITGIVLGITLGYLIALAVDFDFTIPWGVIFVAILIAFVVAIISGLYPAVKASKLDPVEALRYE